MRLLGKNVLQLIISNNWEKHLNSFANLYRIQNVFSEEGSSHFCRDDTRHFSTKRGELTLRVLNETGVIPEVLVIGTCSGNHSFQILGIDDNVVKMWRCSNDLKRGGGLMVWPLHLVSN